MAQSIYVPQIGGFIDFKDEATDAEITAYLKSKFPAAPVAPPPGPPEDGVGAWESSGLGWLSRFQTAGGGFAESLGYGDEARYLYEKAQKNLEESQKYQPEETSITGAETWGGSAEALGEGAIQMAPDMAGGLAAGLAGGAIGAQVGALGGVFAPVTVPAGTLVGGLIGSGLYALGVNTGSNIQRQAQERGTTLEEADEGTAIAAAVPQAALDAFADKILLGKLIPSGTPTNVVRKIIGEGVVKHAVKGAAAEGLTEAAQQAIEIGQANPEKLFDFSNDVQTELLDAAIAGGFLGGGVGAASVPAGKIADYYRARPARQLQEDLGREMGANAQALRQGEISLGAEELRKANVSGDLEIVEEEYDGLPRYVIKTAAGNSYGSFLDATEAEEAVNIYKQRTDANVTIRKVADLPSVFPVKIGGKEYQSTDDIIAERDDLVAKSEGLASYMSRPDVIKREATRQNVSEALVKKAVDEEVGDLNKKISKLNEFVAAAKPKPDPTLTEGDARSEELARARARSSGGKAPTPKPSEPKPTAGKLSVIPYDTLSWDEKQKRAVKSSGENDIIDFGGRKIVVKDVNGVNVPFYLSTGSGGKKDVPAGRWYPFFGVGPTDGWINKTGGTEMASYYGSPELEAAAAELDASIGDIRSDNSTPKVSISGAHIDFINSGLDPSDNGTADTLTKVRNNIDRVKALVSAGRPQPAEQQAAEPEEAPIGSVLPEMPVEEPRFIEEAPEVTPSNEDVPPPRTEMRPSATAEDLSALQTELFGAPKNIREMTAEEEARYVAERDKRFPPEPVEVYSAGPVEAAPVRRRTLAQAEAEGPVVRDYTPETAQRFKDIYTALKGRFSGLNLKNVDVKLEELISADKNYLIRGQARAEKTPNGIKSIVDLSTGILRPDMTVEQAVKELVETLNHEIIHVLRDQGVLRAAEWNVLSKAVANTKVPGRKYTYLDKARAVYTPGGQPISEVYADPDAVIEEAVAEMYKDWVKGANNKEARAVGGLFNRITEFLRRIFRVLKSSRYEGVFKSIEAGEVGAREGTGRESAARFSAGPTTPTLTAGIQDERGNVEVRPFPEVNEGSSSAYLRRDFKKTKTSGRVRDRAWGAALDRAFMEKFGRQFDINNPMDYEHIVMSISDEIKHQMGQVQSGVGWYDNDIQDVFDELSKSFPILKDPAEGPVYRRLFTLIAGVMSNGMKAKANVELASINFAHFLRTGQFSPIHPFTNKGWNQRSNIMGPQIAMLNSMVSDPLFDPRAGSNNPELERYENFLKFMFSEHSVREINQFRARHGTRSPAKIGKVDDRRLGMYAFGPKFGPFILNLNGMSDETVDSWASRSFYRHMGRAIGADGELIQAPFGRDREAMKRALRDIGVATNLSSRDIQAVLWFYEKELFNQLGQKIPLEVFSDGAREFTRKYGTGSGRSPESRTDREREISGAIGDAGARYSPPLERAARGGRFSAAPALSSEEFKKWFKQSRVKNPDGTPRVLYHGTQGKFKTFKTNQSELGAHFGTASQANDFVQGPKSEMSPEDWAEDVKFNNRTDQIFPVYLSVQNPHRMKDTGRWIPSRIAKRLALEGLITLEQSKQISALPLNTPVQIKALQDMLKARGIDGIVYLNRYEGFKPSDPTQFAIDAEDMSDQDFRAKYPEAQDSYLIFDPEQVKSTFNKFEEGAATSPYFSAAPLPPYVESKNRTLFVPEQKRSFFKDMADFFLGPSTQGKTLNTIYGQVDLKGGAFGTRAALNRRMLLVDQDAGIEWLEKTANEKDTGNFQRREATQSVVASMAMARRASQLTASSVMMGAPIVEFSRPGDIQSATVAVRQDADNLMRVFQTMLEPGPVDPVTGKRGDKRTIFKTYATAKRAIGLKAAGKPVPRELDDTYINTTISFTQQNYPEIVEAYNAYQRFNKKLITAARDSGYISDQELSRFTQQMDYYGFYREIYEEQATPGLPTKLAGQIKIREYRGSERGDLIEDPMLVMITNLNFWMGAITRNIAANKAFKLTRDMGEARLLGASEKPDPSLGESEQVMFFREGGAVKRFAVKDPMLVASLGADDRVDMGRAMKLLSAPTGILRETITRDPAFMIANLIRDTLSSWITSGEDITPFVGTAAGFAKALKGTASYHALVGRGVVGSHDLAMKSPAEMAATIRRRALPSNILNVGSIEGAQGMIMSLWDRLGVWSEASDAATRIAVYESAIAKGMSEAEAAFRAIEIMNFNRRGASSLLNMFTKLIPFLNARIQGLDVLYQAGKAGVLTAAGRQLGERDSQLGKKFLVRGAILAAISVGIEMMLEDDEDYKELPDYVKNGNLLIPLKWFGIEGGYFAAIAKPFEAGLIFSTIPQEMYKAATGETSGREVAKLFFSEFVSTFGVNPIPQVALPALEALVNYDFYTDLPLISEGKARLSPELQYDSRTSTVAMLLGGIPIKYNFTTGRFEGISPTIIDQLISGYGGPFGTYLMQGVGMAMEGLDVGPERLPKDITQLPVIKRFLLDAESRNPKSVAQAYELFRVVDEANRSFSRLRQTGDVEATMDYLERNRDILAYKKYVYRLFDGLNKLSAQERRIERDETMTRDEKFEAMKRLREVRTRLTSQISTINKALGR